MTTKMNGQLKRELTIGKHAYTLTLSPVGFVLAVKGRRKGLEIQWRALVSGDAALTTALNASLIAPTLPKSSPKRPAPLKVPIRPKSRKRRRRSA